MNIKIEKAGRSTSLRKYTWTIGYSRSLRRALLRAGGAHLRALDTAGLRAASRRVVRAQGCGAY